MLFWSLSGGCDFRWFVYKEDWEYVIDIVTDRYGQLLEVFCFGFLIFINRDSWKFGSFNGVSIKYMMNETRHDIFICVSGALVIN